MPRFADQFIHAAKTPSLLGEELLAEVMKSGDACDIQKSITLIEQGASIETVSNDFYTPLMRAALQGHEKIVKKLIDTGANIEARNRFQDTALILAASYGRMAPVRLLLDKRADINAVDEYGRTALYMAALYGHTEAVQLLINKGASDLMSLEGKTALTVAKEKKYEEISELLLKEQEKKDYLEFQRATDCGKGLRKDLRIRPPLPLGQKVKRQSSVLKG